MELRCEGNKMHGVMVEPDVIEVSCKSRWCGYVPGTVVLHRFSTDNGECKETLRFHDIEAPTEPLVEQEN